MTDKEKAQAYDEALEKARKKYQEIPVDYLEFIFPQLAESEDERIRKELLAVINDLVLPNEQKARFNAWLEKQKDKMTAEEYEGSELFQLKLKTKYANGYQDGLAQKEQSLRDFIDDFPYSDEQKEQNEKPSKPELKIPDWVNGNWDDEYMINTVIGRYSLHAEVARKRDDIHDYNLSKSMESWLRNVVKPLILEKQKESLHIHETCKENTNSFTDEDEKIRKILLKMAKVPRKEIYEHEGITKEQAISYLEKQKELDKMIIVSPEVWDNAISDAYENGKKDNEKQKENPEEPKIAFGDWGDKEKQESIFNCLKYMRFVKKITNQEYDDLTKWLNDNLVSNVLEKDGWTIANEQTDTIKEDYYGAFLRGEMRGYLRGVKQKKLPFVKDVILGYPGHYYYDGERMHFCGTPAMEEKQKEQKPADFPTTDEEMKDLLDKTPPVVVPEKYKTADWLFDKMGQQPAERKAFKEWVEDYWSHNKVNNPYSYNKGDEVQFDHKGFVSFCEAYCYPQNLVLHDTFGYEEGRQTRQNEGVKFVLNNPEKYGLQKPAEWSKNDTVFLNEITDFFENKTSRLQHDLDMYAHWLKSLPERFNLQPKQEWSEEDERIAYTILNLLCSQVTYVTGQGTTSGKQFPTYAKERDWFEKRFKSLRPQYNGDVTMTEAYKMGKEAGEASSWKPSKDEERLINTAISFLKDFADKGYENAVECIDWLKSKL